MMSFKITMEGEQAIAERYGFVAKTMNAHIKRATAQEAHLLRRMIVVGIRKQAPGGVKFKPLEPSTIKAKGSSKALIDKGDLIRSVNVQKFADGAVYFVGVHKMAAYKDGVSMANIAEVHEFGTKDGRIPARPYLRPSFAEWRKGVEQRMLMRVVESLGLEEPLANIKEKVLMDTSGTDKEFAHQINAVFRGDKLTWDIR